MQQNMTPGGTPPTLTRASTPIPAGEASSAESVAADEAILRQFAVAITDIQAMKSHVLTLWREEISMMLPDMSDAEEQGLPEGIAQSIIVSCRKDSTEQATSCYRCSGKRSINADISDPVPIHSHSGDSIETSLRSPSSRPVDTFPVPRHVQQTTAN